MIVLLSKISARALIGLMLFGSLQLTSSAQQKSKIDRTAYFPAEIFNGKLHIEGVPFTRSDIGLLFEISLKVSLRNLRVRFFFVEGINCYESSLEKSGYFYSIQDGYFELDTSLLNNPDKKTGGILAK
jgi:hypothetical protein